MHAHADDDSELEALLLRFIERHQDGQPVSVRALTAGRPELVEPLTALVNEYLEAEHIVADAYGASNRPMPLPSFPGYDTIEALGRGGAGEVYKVRDKVLGKLFAAKILRRDTRERRIEELVRESQVNGGLKHEFIAEVISFRNGSPPFMVMELVDGKPFGQGRAAAQADVAAGLTREAALTNDLTSANAMVESVKSQLQATEQERDQLRTALSETSARLNEVNEQRAALESRVSELNALMDSQRDRLALRADASAKLVIADNRCMSAVHAAIRVREESGEWPTYSFWDFAPGARIRPTVRRKDGQVVELRATRSQAYVYAKAVDGSWSHQGVNGEQETLMDRGRLVRMKAWNLSVDANDNYIWTMCP